MEEHAVAPAASLDDAYRASQDALRAVRDVVLGEEWFAERPPLTLAIAHPMVRLWCEMWRTARSPDLHAASTAHAEPSALSHDTDPATAHQPPRPAPFVWVGRRRLRNPAAAALPTPAAADHFSSGTQSLTTAAAVLATSPYAAAAPGAASRVTPLVAPLSALPVPSAAQREAATGPPITAPRSALRGVPVVDPTAPLYSLETYAETIQRLDVGVRVGHVRLVAVWLPCEAACDPSAGGGTAAGRRVRLVRGLFGHVPAALTIAAAHRSATAVHAAEAQRVARAAPVHDAPAAAAAADEGDGAEGEGGGEGMRVAGAPCPTERAAAHTSASREGSEADAGTDADADESSDGAAEDWETAALLEEAQLHDCSSPRPLTVTHPAAATPAPGPVARSRTAAGRRPPPPAAADPQARRDSAAAPAAVPQAVSAASAAAAALPVTAGSSHAEARDAVDGVAAVLPPPCGWWLRRGVPVDGASPLVPLYAHCVDATRQWLDWLEAGAPTCLCGVSLSGWCPAYVQPRPVPPPEPARCAAPMALEDAVSATLPLRGLHLESSTASLARLLRGGTALSTSLVALDTPHLRRLETASPPGDAGAVEGLGVALRCLPQLRYLSLKHSPNVLTSATTSDGAAVAARTEPMAAICAGLRELDLHGVGGLCAATLAGVAHTWGSLRTLDLTRTEITAAMLEALITGTCTALAASTPEAGGDATEAGRTSSRDAAPAATPLARLERVALTACRALTRVAALAALPRLRRLDLQASGVTHAADLVGCDALEELVLTRCEHLRALHPLWRLPRLRCVEADGVRQRPEEVLLMPALPATGPRADMDTLFAAPLVRLNLAQSSVVRGHGVGHLARCLRAAGRQLTSLVVLQLDHTEVDNATVRVLAGLGPTTDGAARDFEGAGGGSYRGPDGDDVLGGLGAACVPAAVTSLQELSLVGCAHVRHLGPLGLLPQLTRLIADGAGVEHVEGLQRSRSLVYVSLSHCSQLGAISPLAYIASLRSLDVSRTPLNDAALLRFVYPAVVTELVERVQDPAANAAALEWAAGIARDEALVPSRVERLRLYQCTALQHISCVAHLPRLRALDASHTAVFDHGFTGFFGRLDVLLRTQTWLTAQRAEQRAAGTDAVGGIAPLPDEPAMLHAWRTSVTDAAAAAVHHGVPAAVTRAVVFDFDVGAVSTLTHVSLAYCTEVRCVAAFALFPRLAVFDLTGTAVDSASLLMFVNVLLEGCRSADDGDGAGDGVPAMRLELEGDGLHPRPIPDRRQLHRARRRPFALTSLTLSWCHYVTDVRCCAAVPSLRRLDVSGSPIDNASIAALVWTGAALMTAAELRWWRSHRCALETLDVSYCRGVTDVAPLFEGAAGAGAAVLRRHGFRPHVVSELVLHRSGVVASKSELRALDPHGHCRVEL